MTAISRRTMLGSAIALGTTGLFTAAAHPAYADAAADPAIIGADAWGARPASSTVKVLAAKPHKIIVHHTATANTTDYSYTQAVKLAQSIQDYHMDVNGWIDTGQQFTVSRGAYILEGRHKSVAALQNTTQHVEGAHCTGQNAVAIGIENEGTYTSVQPRAAQYAALVDLCAYICGRYGLRPYQIYGHRDFNNTQCPGDSFYPMLSKLRSDVAAVVGGDPTAPVWPVLRSGDTGEDVKTLQYLLRQRGYTITADGVYGSATVTAVKDFQRTTRATEDGIAGNQTWNQAVLPLARGASGEAVKAVQSQLTAHSIPTTVDGVFGAGTESGVRTFQTWSALPSDGVVDARTWSRLLV